jgi:hypothetical protein
MFINFLSWDIFVRTITVTNCMTAVPFLEETNTFAVTATFRLALELIYLGVKPAETWNWSLTSFHCSG